DGTLNVEAVSDASPYHLAANSGWDPGTNEMWPEMAEAWRNGSKEWDMRQAREIQKARLGIAAQIPVLDAAVLAGVLSTEHEGLDAGLSFALAAQGSLSSAMTPANRTRQKAMLKVLESALWNIENDVKKRKKVTKRDLEGIGKVAELLAEGSSARQDRLIEIQNRIHALAGDTVKLQPTVISRAQAARTKTEPPSTRQVRVGEREMRVVPAAPRRGPVPTDEG